MTAWKALFVGDVHLGERAGLWIAPALAPLIASHDLVSCNFEGPIAVPGAPRASKAGSWLSQPPSVAHTVLKAGFDVINLANNHLFDYGEAGVDATLAAFQQATTLGAGLDAESAYALREKQVAGVSVGLLAYGEGENGAVRSGRGAGFAWIQDPGVDDAVHRAKRRLDVLIVQVHAGVEEVELPLPEWRTRFRQLIALGADAVIAHHPHVPQGWEVVDGKPIFYSLGNFLFESAHPSELWNRGYMVSLRFDDAKFRGFDVLPIERTAAGVDACADPSFRSYLDGLCRMLEDPRYDEFADAQAVELWRRRYMRYYRDVGIGVAASPLRALTGSRKKSSSGRLLLQHLLESESHLWTVRRALAALERERDPRA